MTNERVVATRDVMAAPAAKCTLDTDLAAVAKLMWDRDCGFVPVVDASDRVLGVLTDRDICIATATRRQIPEHVLARDAMRRPVHTCRLDDPISVALGMMKEFRIRRLPVTSDEGTLEGVVSINDIVRTALDKRTPAAREVLVTMAAICEHRSVTALVS